MSSLDETLTVEVPDEKVSLEQILAAYPVGTHLRFRLIWKLSRGYYRTGQLATLDRLVVQRLTYHRLTTGLHEIFDCSPRLAHQPPWEEEELLILKLPELGRVLKLGVYLGCHQLLLSQLHIGIDNIQRSLRTTRRRSLIGNLDSINYGDTALTRAYVTTRMDQLRGRKGIFAHNIRAWAGETLSVCALSVALGSSKVDLYADYAKANLELLLREDFPYSAEKAPTRIVIAPLRAEHLPIGLHGPTQKALLSLIANYAAREFTPDEVYRSIVA